MSADRSKILYASVLLGLGVLWSAPTLTATKAFADPANLEQAMPPTSLARATLTQQDLSSSDTTEQTAASSSEAPSSPAPSEQSSSVPKNFAEAMPPTSLAHATLTEEEIKNLSGNSTDTNNSQAPASSASPATADMGPTETLDTSSDHAADNASNNNGTSDNKNTANDKDTASSMTSPSSPASAEAAVPTAQAAAMPTPAAAAVPAPTPTSALTPNKTTASPLSLAHATLTGSEIPRSSVDNIQNINEPDANDSAIAAETNAEIKDVDKDIATAQKMEQTDSKEASAAPAPADNAKPQPAEAKVAANIPPVKKETDAQLNQPLETSAVANEDENSIDPAVLKSWSEKVELLERENIALRDRLQMKDTDKLADIKVDAVAQIHENVLRNRVAELEKELDKLRMQQDPNNAGDLPKPDDDITKAVKGALPPPPPAGKAGPPSGSLPPW